jgi:CheY-like chemotaxis protein
MSTNELNNGYRILVIDDDVINRFSLLMMLKEIKVPKFELSNGKGAMEMIGQLKGEKMILLLDLNMPVMNGYEVIKELSHHPELFHSIHIIVISGTLKEDFNKKGLNKYISNYIEKPVSRDNLISTVTECLKKLSE